jgi:hypothetical protein
MAACAEDAETLISKKPGSRFADSRRSACDENVPP